MIPLSTDAEYDTRSVAFGDLLYVRPLMVVPLMVSVLRAIENVRDDDEADAAVAAR